MSIKEGTGAKTTNFEDKDVLILEMIASSTKQIPICMVAWAPLLNEQDYEDYKTQNSRKMRQT